MISSVKISEDNDGNFSASSVGLGLQARSPRVDHEPAVLDRERLRVFDLGHHERQVGLKVKHTVHTAYSVIGFSVKSGIMSILGWYRFPYTN